jgi:O-antigen ligase
MEIDTHEAANAGAAGQALAVASVTTAAMIALMSLPGKALGAGLAAVVGVGGLIWLSRFVSSHRAWLLGLLVLEELLPYANVIPYDPQSRWIFRYPILAALCIPMVPAAWRSGILLRGNFKAFALYYAWAAATTIYSLAPAASVGRLLPAILLFVGLSAMIADISAGVEVRNILLRFLVCCGVILALQMVAAVALPSAMSWSAEEPGLPPRFSGIFNTPNVLGQLLVVVVGAGAVCWPHVSGWRKATLGGLIAISAALAAVADSRSGFVALGIGGTLYAIWRYRLKGLLACVAAALVAGAIWISLSSGARVYLNRGAANLSGRTEAWRFEVHQIERRPLTGYGYDVEGQIFQDRLFPDWGAYWLRGANTSLHNGYLGIAIGVGIPATLLWLWAFIRPWLSLFAGDEDPWELKSMALLVVVPLLTLALVESPLDPIRYPKGLLLCACWMAAERFRLLERERAASVVPTENPLFRTIQLFPTA